MWLSPPRGAPTVRHRFFSALAPPFSRRAPPFRSALASPLAVSMSSSDASVRQRRYESVELQPLALGVVVARVGRALVDVSVAVLSLPARHALALVRVCRNALDLRTWRIQGRTRGCKSTRTPSSSAVTSARTFRRGVKALSTRSLGGVRRGRSCVDCRGRCVRGLAQRSV